MTDERTEPYEVCIKGQGDTIGYACPKCHMFCSPTIYACKWEDALKAAYQHALSCCADRMCSECGVNMGSPRETAWLMCAACRQERAAVKEAERFDLADKIPLSEYDGSFLYYDDEYYDDYELLFDAVDDRPAYAWACNPIDFAMDASDIVYAELENGDHHEDAWEEVPRRDLERLQKYMDLWCKKVAVRSYLPNFKLAVLLPPPEQEND
jgi:hypothetical protein